MNSSSESEEPPPSPLEEARSQLEVINIEGDDYEDKSEGTFDLEEPLNPLYELPDAQGTPSKKDKDATNACLKQRNQKPPEDDNSPVIFDLKSPVRHAPSQEEDKEEAQENGSSGPTTYTVLQEEEETNNMDPDSLVGEPTSDKEESYSNEAFEQEQESESSLSSSSESRREPNTEGIASSDQSSAQDQKNGVSFFVDFDEEQASSPSPSCKHRLRRRRTNTLDERMTQSVIEDRRSLDSQSSLSFYVDLSQNERLPMTSKPTGCQLSKLPPPPPLLPKKTQQSALPPATNLYPKKIPTKKVTLSKKKKTAPRTEDNFETIKSFFKRLLRKVDELACSEDRSLSGVRKKKRLAERIVEFLDEEETKLSKGQVLTLESKIDASLSQDSIQKPPLRRERTFDLDSTEPKKMVLVDIKKSDASQARRNMKLFAQQKVFLMRRLKREMTKIDNRICELEKQITRERKTLLSRKQCWPMSDRELQIVEDSKPKRRLPAPTYPAPRLPTKKLNQSNRMSQSLIEESPSGTCTSFLEIASKKQQSKERIKINVTDRSGISPSYSWYLNQGFSSNDDFEPEDEIVWIRRESPRQYYYEERSFYSPSSVLTRKSRFSDPEDGPDHSAHSASHIPRPSPSGGRRASVNNFGQTFPSPSRKNSEALMNSGLAVRKTKGTRPPVASSPISTRGVQTYSPPWGNETTPIPFRGATEIRQTEYIDLDTDEYVLESRRKIGSPPLKKDSARLKKIPKTRSPYEPGIVRKSSNLSKRTHRPKGGGSSIQSRNQNMNAP